MEKMWKRKILIKLTSARGKQGVVTVTPCSYSTNGQFSEGR